VQRLPWRFLWPGIAVLENPPGAFVVLGEMERAGLLLKGDQFDQRRLQLSLESGAKQVLVPMKNNVIWRCPEKC